MILCRVDDDEHRQQLSISTAAVSQTPKADSGRAHYANSNSFVIQPCRLQLDLACLQTRSRSKSRWGSRSTMVSVKRKNKIRTCNKCWGNLCRDCERCWVTRFKPIKISQDCANEIIIHRIWKIGSITKLAIAKSGEAVRGPSSRAMLTFRSEAMCSGRCSSSRTHHCAALGAVIEIA
jgi:hypothetical protein